MATKIDIAIVGAGVSGISAAHHLQHNHRVTLFEQNSRIGGHANTVCVKDKLGQEYDIDTGFIVFNDKNYPLFSDFLNQLNIDRRLLPTFSMGKAASCSRIFFIFGFPAAL